MALAGARARHGAAEERRRRAAARPGKVKTIAVIGPTRLPGRPGAAAAAPRWSRSRPSACSRGSSNARRAGAACTTTRGMPTLAEHGGRDQLHDRGERRRARRDAPRTSTNADLAGHARRRRTIEHAPSRSGCRCVPSPATSASGADLGSAGPATTRRRPRRARRLRAARGEGGGSYRLFVDDKLVIDNWDALEGARRRGDADARRRRRTRSCSSTTRRPTWQRPRLALGIVAARERGSIPRPRRLAAKADVVVVAVGLRLRDRKRGRGPHVPLPPGQDELIRAMAAANKNTVVVRDVGRRRGHARLDRPRPGAGRGLVSRGRKAAPRSPRSSSAT